MPNSTKMISIPIFRNVDQMLALNDSLGSMSMRIATAKFLDVENLAKVVAASIKKRKKSKTRDLTLVDGTKLSTEKSKDGDKGTAAESSVLQDISIKGSKSIILVTGKITPNKNNKRVSIRFPSWATNLVISDALGTIIPPTKIKVEPTGSDIFPYFISPGGRRYPILTKDAALGDKRTEVPTTSEAVKLLASRLEDTEILPAQGG